MTNPTSNPAAGSLIPPVVSVRRDAVHREIRLELADWKTRTGGVYDLDPEQQEQLLLAGHLPPHKPFLPDFVIIYGTGEPTTVATSAGLMESVEWTDLRVHAGGPHWRSVQKGLVRSSRSASSTEWHNLDALLHGNLRAGGRTSPAPAWLLDLIRDLTPFEHLLGHMTGNIETLTAQQQGPIEDAIGLLLHSLDRTTGGIDDGVHLHALVHSTDGDGTNEPYSLSTACECGTWTGIDWIQTDTEQRDRPSDTDLLLAWSDHVAIALGDTDAENNTDTEATEMTL